MENLIFNGVLWKIVMKHGGKEIRVNFNHYIKEVKEDFIHFYEGYRKLLQSDAKSVLKMFILN